MSSNCFLDSFDWISFVFWQHNHNIRDPWKPWIVWRIYQYPPNNGLHWSNLHGIGFCVGFNNTTGSIRVFLHFIYLYLYKYFFLLSTLPGNVWQAREISISVLAGSSKTKLGSGKTRLESPWNYILSRLLNKMFESWPWSPWPGGWTSKQVMADEIPSIYQ